MKFSCPHLHLHLWAYYVHSEKCAQFHVPTRLQEETRRRDPWNGNVLYKFGKQHDWHVPFFFFGCSTLCAAFEETFLFFSLRTHCDCGDGTKREAPHIAFSFKFAFEYKIAQKVSCHDVLPAIRGRIVNQHDYLRFLFYSSHSFLAFAAQSE